MLNEIFESFKRKDRGIMYRIFDWNLSEFLGQPDPRNTYYDGRGVVPEQEIPKQ
ncbi:hypothetical protein pb186bvf_006630 [Paramecium bursaria]